MEVQSFFLIEEYKKVAKKVLMLKIFSVTGSLVAIFSKMSLKLVVPFFHTVNLKIALFVVFLII